MSVHRDLTGEQVHVPYTWTYTNSTTRTSATGFIPSDVGKLARQLDDNTLWMLTDDSPATWQGLGSSLPTASTTVLGGVKVDGTTVTITDGVISSVGGSGATVVFPFYKSDGTGDTIALVAGTALPFYKADGSSDNITLIAP